MIQVQTELMVADNTGAKRVECIKVLGGSKRRYASIGDIIKVSVKEAIPKGKVKKGSVHNAVVVRVKKGIYRNDGSKVKFDNNLKLLLDTDFYHRMRVKNGMPHIILGSLVANREHDDRISSQATSKYDCVVEHPEGNWLMNSRELQYVHEKYPEFMTNPKYPDED